MALWLLASVTQAGVIARVEHGTIAFQQCFRTAQRAVERFPGKVALRRPREMVVPDIAKGVVQADPFEAVVEAYRPTLRLRFGRELLLGQLLETSDTPGAQRIGQRIFFGTHAAIVALSAF